MITLLPVYQFAKVLGLHPLHIMGIDANIGSAESRVCVHPIQQYSWQDADGVSREELGWYISEAEQEIADYLGYWPMPTWSADERVEIEQRPGAWYTSLLDVRGDALSVKAQRGQVISGGIRAKTLIQAAAAVVYTDADSDTYVETATITQATTVTDPQEIALYYPGLSGDDDWEIRPIQVSIAAGVATIVCRREQLVKKDVLERLDPTNGVSGLTNANFLTTVDVYRKYNDPGTQVQLVWRGGSCTCSGDTTCEQCGLTIQNGCLTVKDRRLGLVAVQPGDWNATSQTFDWTEPAVCGRRPDYLRLWYRSGYIDATQPNIYTSMARMWQIAVAKLAISKLDRLICSCKAVQDVQSHWSTDLRKGRATRGESSTYKVTTYELENCPFGTTVAGLDVWRLCRRHTIAC